MDTAFFLCSNLCQKCYQPPSPRSSLELNASHKSQSNPRESWAISLLTTKVAVTKIHKGDARACQSKPPSAGSIRERPHYFSLLVTRNDCHFSEQSGLFCFVFSTNEKMKNPSGKRFNLKVGKHKTLFPSSSRARRAKGRG